MNITFAFSPSFSGDIQEINGEDDAQTEGRLAFVTLGVLVLIFLLPLNALFLRLVYEGYRDYIEVGCYLVR